MLWPATPFETAGSEINLDDVEYLLKKDEVVYLAEMMNWPGVLRKDQLVIPSLKLSDKGLFEGNEFRFVDLYT